MDPASPSPKFSLSSPDNEISFLDHSETYCVCFVDMVNSTNITAHIVPSDLRKFYGTFLNAMAGIARKFQARIIKNGGDSLIFYFPDTADPKNAPAFKNCLDCCLEMINAHLALNSVMELEGLPHVDYRISADYGRVEIAKSKTSIENDLIGTTMNICAKINSAAKPNTVVIGSDLYEILCSSSFPFRSHYNCHQSGAYSSGLKYAYPLFSIANKDDFANPVNGCQQAAQKFKIMVIDDEQDVLASYKLMLENTGIIDVDTFSSSQEALHHFFTKGLTYYSLIITDIRMPAPNGIQLYNIFKSADNRAKILFVTACDIVDEVLSMLPGVRRDQIIRKPVGHEKLVERVKLALA